MLFLIICLGLLLTHAHDLQATLRTNKTFLMPRPTLTNMAMEPQTWHHNVVNNELTKTFQLTPFYKASDNNEQLGFYFGYKTAFTNQLRDFINVVSGPIASQWIPTPDAYGFHARYLLHEPGVLSPDGFAGKIKFRPYQKAYGVGLDYHHDLNRHFFFKIRSHVDHIEHSMGAFSDSKQYPYQGDPRDSRTGKTIADFFAGNMELITDIAPLNEGQQKALTHAKIAGTQSTAGLADIKLQCGYNVARRCALGINIVIPTGNKARGEYLFEPIRGNGKHWALGATVDATFTLFKKEHNKSIELFLSSELQYLFQNTQQRTLRLLNDQGALVDFGQYILAGERDTFPLFPLANVLNQNLHVTPGITTQGLASILFSIKKAWLSIGYTIFAKEKERVSLKNTWDDTKYAVANALDTNGEAYRTAPVPAPAPANAMFYGPFNPDNPNHVDETVIGKDGPILLKNLALNATKTPTQLTQTIQLNGGYMLDLVKQCSLQLSSGMAYEFTHKNSALQGYSFWGRMGLVF